jgi:hypothetical protein
LSATEDLARESERGREEKEKRGQSREERKRGGRKRKVDPAFSSMGQFRKKR